MLNIDMALVRDFDGFINPTTGQVSCQTITAATAASSTAAKGVPICPQASTFDLAVEYAFDNAGWLEDFNEAMTKMVLNGHTVPTNCASFPCKLSTELCLSCLVRRSLIVRLEHDDEKV
jgi:hypothetical protein